MVAEGGGEEEEAGELGVGNDLGEGIGIAFSEGLVGVVGTGVVGDIDNGDTKGLLDGGTVGSRDAGISEEGGEGGDGCEDTVIEITDQDHAINGLGGERINAAGGDQAEMFVIELAIIIGVVLANEISRNRQGEAAIGIGNGCRFRFVFDEVAVEIKPDIGVHQGRAGGGAAGDEVAGLDQFADEVGLHQGHIPAWDRNGGTGHYRGTGGALKGIGHWCATDGFGGDGDANRSGAEHRRNGGEHDLGGGDAGGQGGGAEVGGCELVVVRENGDRVAREACAGGG